MSKTSPMVWLTQNNGKFRQISMLSMNLSEHFYSTRFSCNSSKIANISAKTRQLVRSDFE